MLARPLPFQGSNKSTAGAVSGLDPSPYLPPLKPSSPANSAAPIACSPSSVWTRHGPEVIPRSSEPTPAGSAKKRSPKSSPWASASPPAEPRPWPMRRYSSAGWPSKRKPKARVCAGYSPSPTCEAWLPRSWRWSSGKRAARTPWSPRPSRRAAVNLTWIGSG